MMSHLTTVKLTDVDAALQEAVNTELTVPEVALVREEHREPDALLSGRFNVAPGGV